MKKRLFSRAEAAEYLGIAAPTLVSWEKNGNEEIPFIRLGSRVLYDVNDLNEFIENKKSQLKGECNE